MWQGGGGGGEGKREGSKDMVKEDKVMEKEEEGTD